MRKELSGANLGESNLSVASARTDATLRGRAYAYFGTSRSGRQKKINTQSAPERENLEGRPTVVRSFNCKNQIGDQKLKEVPHSETLSAMCGRDARSVSEEKGNAAIYTQVLRLASNHWALATTQHPKGRKIMDFEAPQATQSGVLFPFPD